MITIKIGGKAIRTDQFAREMEKAVVKQIKQELPKKIKDPITGKRIHTRVTGTTLKNLKIKGV